ncbi:MAG: hypothetical protein E4H21_08565 [Thermodesulfobacteriales bacterium]|nr:MAG: hypothetical protein E4H21_08565 [Thermodesulfobacteriales bacterium]
MNAIITLAVGILAGWLITALYYRKSSRDQRHLLEKVPEEVRKALKEDQRDRLTVRELNELLESKTIDKTKTGLEVFKVCPKCGSSHLSKGKNWEVSSPDDAFQYNEVWCADCDWSKNDLFG